MPRETKRKLVAKVTITAQFDMEDLSEAARIEPAIQVARESLTSAGACIEVKEPVFTRVEK